MRIKYPFQSKIDIRHFETTSIFRSENCNFPSKLNPKDKSPISIFIAIFIGYVKDYSKGENEVSFEASVNLQA